MNMEENNSIIENINVIENIAIEICQVNMNLK